MFIKKQNIKKRTQTFSDSYFATGNIFYYDPQKLMKTKNYNMKYIPYIIESFRAIDIDDSVDFDLTKKIYKLI